VEVAFDRCVVGWPRATKRRLLEGDHASGICSSQARRLRVVGERDDVLMDGFATIPNAAFVGSDLAVAGTDGTCGPVAP